MLSWRTLKILWTIVFKSNEQGASEKHPPSVELIPAPISLVFVPPLLCFPHDRLAYLAFSPITILLLVVFFSMTDVVVFTVSGCCDLVKQ